MKGVRFFYWGNFFNATILFLLPEMPSILFIKVLLLNPSNSRGFDFLSFRRQLAAFSFSVTKSRFPLENNRSQSVYVNVRQSYLCSPPSGGFFILYGNINTKIFFWICDTFTTIVTTINQLVRYFIIWKPCLKQWNKSAVFIDLIGIIKFSMQIVMNVSSVETIRY